MSNHLNERRESCVRQTKLSIDNLAYIQAFASKQRSSQKLKEISGHLQEVNKLLQAAKDIALRSGKQIPKDDADIFGIEGEPTDKSEEQRQELINRLDELYVQTINESDGGKLEKIEKEMDQIRFRVENMVGDD